MILLLYPIVFLQSFFGAPRIPFHSVNDIEASTPHIIIWAAPAMFFFVLAEWYLSRKQNRPLYDAKDSVGSIAVGVGNVIINFFLKITFFYLIIFIYNKVPWRFSLSWWTIIPCYLIFDFCSYWSHRISHQQRFWWATHVVHHSSENYNLTVSFRLSWVQNMKIIFFLPVAFIGFHPIIFFVASQVAVLFQFWVHTEYIRRLHPLFEYVFATPSNHRVHHGSQDKYINKNYGATFIFWDRIFSTYQKEEEQALYGITTNVTNKANPLMLNFHEYIDIWHDIKSTKSFKRKMFFLFGDPVDIAREKKISSFTGADGEELHEKIVKVVIKSPVKIKI
ncbi:MAG: sterol desaturase family protein [Bacteroidota bacterium]|nr:sterol desaturase family protein [Bacteroidota bacterium]